MTYPSSLLCAKGNKLQCVFRTVYRLWALPSVPGSLGVNWFAWVLPSPQLDKPWDMVVVKEGGKVEKRRSSKRGRNKGRWP